MYEFGKCADICNCFDCSKFYRFAYVKPVLQEDGVTVTIESWADDKCETTGHDMTVEDPAAVGWEGSCDDKCWSTWDRKDAVISPRCRSRNGFQD